MEALEAKNFEESGDCESCKVCREDFVIGVEVTLMPCLHIFHKGCIVVWLGSRYT
ncbi:hypothetical protein GIB67_039212 [Kingdonia uniflora]|uniref:RING-type domain-containing protein n=1 Tax=Kingdonia uniflora TaxID=39325 RepID=A0A7J7MLY9_9MAGN|nr:hypothetical protein GIB67_039212 [Kingdonia uniflora]